MNRPLHHHQLRLTRCSNLPVVASPPCRQQRRQLMANKGNYFNALAGLKLEDSPASSPTAAAAAAASAHDAAEDAAAATSSSDQAEALKGGLEQEHQQQQRQQQQQQQPDPQQAASTSSSSTDGNPQAAAAGRSKPKSSKKVPNPLVWIDLEMTGLDPNKDTIIEIACLITDGDLNRVWEGPDIAIHHPESVLAGMNEWCVEHHNKSGLVQRVRDSTISLQEAEQQVLAFVQQHAEYKQAQLAGNSIHVDRVFLQRYMPQLVEHLHYRIVDVSTLKELCRRWRPRLYRQAPKKAALHTAMSDIKESLKELQYYKQVLFRGK